ncbi:MAG: NUDIX domain-containing protein [Candidatus Sericytochromatia bacterium]
MPMSAYYQRLRAALGSELLLMPAVAAVIHDPQGRLLLQQTHDGSWSLPAGAIEPGETPEAAVAREVLEETGLRCTDVRLLQVLGGPNFRHTYPNGDRVEYVLLLFRCRVAAEAPVAFDVAETRSLRYVSRADFPGLELPYVLDVLFAGDELLC